MSRAGGHVGGVNLVGGTLGRRSMVRWQASTAARSPARLLGVIGEKEWCAVFTVKW
jgi:hypothetical protein